MIFCPPKKPKYLHSYLTDAPREGRGRSAAPAADAADAAADEHAGDAAVGAGERGATL